MPDIYSIRQVHERQGWSVRRIARELRYSRKTVVKYLNRTEEAPEAPTYVRSQPAPAPQLGSYHPVIRQWLEAYRTAPRK